MTDGNDTKPSSFEELGNITERPKCIACGDPVKMVIHSGVPKAAQHCRECYAELNWGKIPKLKKRRIL